MTTKTVVPFALVPPVILKKIALKFRAVGAYFEKAMPYYQLGLERADFDIKARDYFSMCIAASLVFLIFIGAPLTLFFLKEGNPLLGVAITVPFTAVIFMMHINYPKVVAHKKIKKLDVDLLGALRAIMIQLNAGVSLFESLVAISNQEFGEISVEFRKAVKQINGGVPQIEALETMAVRNPSPYFRRALWQIINGMKEGAQINQVIENVVMSLNKEQIIQIEKYGSQLNPLAMFYMIVVVIMPALGLTFLIVIASFVGLPEDTLKLVLWTLLGFIVFFQLMFAGIIKSKRPSLLGE